MVKCPNCAEEIQDAAIKCRYCGGWLNEKKHLGKAEQATTERELRPIDQVEDWESYANLFCKLPRSEQASRWERLSMVQRQLLEEDYGIKLRSKLDREKPGWSRLRRLVPSWTLVIIVAAIGLVFALALAVISIAPQFMEKGRLAYGGFYDYSSALQSALFSEDPAVVSDSLGEEALASASFKDPERPASKPKPKPRAKAKPKEWTAIQQWVGDGAKTTETFEVSSPEWRIDWQTQGETLKGEGVFSIYVYNDGGSIVSLVANATGEGEGVSYIRGHPGKYYIEISAANIGWGVVVQDTL